MIIIIFLQPFPEWITPKPPLPKIFPYHIPIKRDSFLFSLEAGGREGGYLKLKKNHDGFEYDFETEYFNKIWYMDAKIFNLNGRLRFFKKGIFLKLKNDNFFSNKRYKSSHSGALLVYYLQKDFLSGVFLNISKREEVLLNEEHTYGLSLFKRFDNTGIFLSPFIKNKFSVSAGVLNTFPDKRYRLFIGWWENYPELWIGYEKYWKGFYLSFSGGLKNSYFNMDSLYRALLVYREDYETDLSCESFLNISAHSPWLGFSMGYKKINSIFLKGDTIPLISQTPNEIFDFVFFSFIEEEEASNFFTFAFHIESEDTWLPLWEIRDTIETTLKNIGFSMGIDVVGPRRIRDHDYHIKIGTMVSYLNDKIRLTAGIENITAENFEVYPGIYFKKRTPFLKFLFKFF